MGWLVFMVVAGIIMYQLLGSKNNQQVYNLPADKTVSDDFAGDSVDSFFLLEEFIDPDIDEQESAIQSFTQDDEGEDDFFEEEFFD